MSKNPDNSPNNELQFINDIRKIVNDYAQNLPHYVNYHKESCIWRRYNITRLSNKLNDTIATIRKLIIECPDTDAVATGLNKAINKLYDVTDIHDRFWNFLYWREFYFPLYDIFNDYLKGNYPVYNVKRDSAQQLARTQKDLERSQGKLEKQKSKITKLQEQQQKLDVQVEIQKEEISVLSEQLAAAKIKLEDSTMKLEESQKTLIDAWAQFNDFKTKAIESIAQ